MNDIGLYVIVGITAMLLLFGSFLIAFITSQNKKLRYQKDMDLLRQAQHNQLIEAAIRSEETERHRIAETLHDEVGAILSASKLHLQGIKTDCLDDRDKQLHEKGKELLDEVIQKVRGISHNLHSHILKEFGLNAAIRHFSNKMIQGTLIQITADLDDDYTTIIAENDISIYRMIQELVNNILKHADAKEIRITSSFKNDSLEISVFHTGSGLTQQEFEDLRYKKEGLGLKNIQNRLTLLKGSIQFSSALDGYRIHIQVPVNLPYK